MGNNVRTSGYSQRVTIGTSMLWVEGDISSWIDIRFSVRDQLKKITNIFFTGKNLKKSKQKIRGIMKES